MIFGQNDFKSYLLKRGAVVNTTRPRPLAAPLPSLPTACVVLNIQQRTIFWSVCKGIVVQEVHVRYLISWWVIVNSIKNDLFGLLEINAYDKVPVSPCNEASCYQLDHCIGLRSIRAWWTTSEEEHSLHTLSLPFWSLVASKHRRQHANATCTKILIVYVGRMTYEAVLCILSTVPSMCPNRLKYLNLLRDMESFFCTVTEQEGSLKHFHITCCWYCRVKLMTKNTTKFEGTQTVHCSHHIYEKHKKS